MIYFFLSKRTHVDHKLRFWGRGESCKLMIYISLFSFAKNHRVLEGAPPTGRQLYFTFPSAPDPLFKASKALFLALRVATPSGAPCQAPLEKTKGVPCPI